MIWMSFKLALLYWIIRCCFHVYIIDKRERHGEQRIAESKTTLGLVEKHFDSGMTDGPSSTRLSHI